MAGDPRREDGPVQKVHEASAALHGEAAAFLGRHGMDRAADYERALAESEEQATGER